MKQDTRKTIYDPLRKKEVALTPEEGVRQAFVSYLIQIKGYPPELMANELAIKVGRTEKRCDTVVFANDLTPLVIVEYKAPGVPLTQEVINQAFRYNATLHVPYIILSNGAQVIVYRVGYAGTPSTRLEQIPVYNELTH